MCIRFFPRFSTGLLVGRAKQIRTLVFYLQHICTCTALLALTVRDAKTVLSSTLACCRNSFGLAGPMASLLAVLGITLGSFVLASEKLEGTLRELPSWGVPGCRVYNRKMETSAQVTRMSFHRLLIALSLSYLAQICGRATTWPEEHVLQMCTSPV